MKKIILRGLVGVILLTMLFTVGLNYYINMRRSREMVRQTSHDLFRQVERLLEDNEEAIEESKAALRKDCISSAKAVAYMLQRHPENAEDIAELQKIAQLLQIDEIHIFDKEGTIISGSNPKYFGMNFQDGEQMQFFLPMLKDSSLELCQDMTPNTAEKKMMQYAAVWQEDGEGIIQIGIQPEQVMEAMKKNELSYIFSLVTSDSNEEFLVIDPLTNCVIGSTQAELIGQSARTLGLRPEDMDMGEDVYTVNIRGEKNLCVYKKTDARILARIYKVETIYQNIGDSTFLTMMYLLLLSFFMAAFIFAYLDKHIVKGITAVNQQLLKITRGNWDTKLEEHTTPEFTELSNHINAMVQSLLDTTNKLSVVFDAADILIGAYEYNPAMKRVLVTRRVGELLGLTEEEVASLLSDYTLFKKKIDEIRKFPLEGEKNTFFLQGKELRYLRIEAFPNGPSIMGIIMDVTQEIKEKHDLRYERDIDFLTGLYSRRAFFAQTECLFQEPEKLGHSLMVMIDADELKRVNDCYGHENGDRFLRAIAQLLHCCDQKNKIAARLSGDEFVLFFYSYADREELEKALCCIMEKRDKEKAELANEIFIPISFSIGCSFYPEDGQDCQHLLKLADERMYEEKKQRKKRKKKIDNIEK